MREDPVDGGVSRPLPRRLAVLAARGELQSLLQEPKQRLPRGPQFLELAEDEEDRLPDTAIRILLPPLFFGLEEAHGSGHEQFAAPSFLVSGFNRPLPQQI
jgi:hypothetical protein